MGVVRMRIGSSAGSSAGSSVWEGCVRGEEDGAAQSIPILAFSSSSPPPSLSFPPGAALLSRLSSSLEAAKGVEERIKKSGERARSRGGEKKRLPPFS